MYCFQNMGTYWKLPGFIKKADECLKVYNHINFAIIYLDTK